MKFLANENFPFPSIQLIRQAGFEVNSISEENFGITDFEVLDIASQNEQIILTFDKDYGEIIFKHKPLNPPAVVFFRFKGNSPSEAGLLLLNLILKEKIILEGCFTVVEEESIRQRIY